MIRCLESALPIAAIVDGGDLALTALAALVGGLFVALSFSLAVYGLTRYAEHRRSGDDLAAFGAGALGALGVLASIAAVVFGLLVMVLG